MPNNVPIHVATVGLVSSQSITIATDGFIGVDGVTTGVCDPKLGFNGNVGALIGNPRQDWYVRKDLNDPLFGPLTWQHADAVARRTSIKSGTAELVTYLGNLDRGGDPVRENSQLFIVFLYIAGKRTLGSRAATFNTIGAGCVPTPTSPVSGTPS